MRKFTNHLEIFIYWYAVISLMIPNIALCFTESLPLWASLANILLPLGAYMALMTITRKTGKMVWWLFLFIFFGAFQLVLLYLFGKGVIAVDMFLNLVTTNPGEVTELLDNLIPGVVGVFVLYLPLLALGVVSIRSKKATVLTANIRKFYRKTAAAAGTLGLVCLILAYTGGTGYKMRNDLYPANVLYNMYLAFERNAQSENYKETSAQFRFDAKSTHPADSTEVYIMVIGETARAMDFSLYGYDRPTTPLLEATDGVVTFSNVTTQSNTTHKSVPMILSAVSARDFNNIYNEKGIIAAFHEAGFTTTFLSNQQPNHSLIDFLGQQADEWLFVKTGDGNMDVALPKADEMGNIYDTTLLPLLDKILAKHRKKAFIVLHTYGSHFNYMERYPRNMAHFKPDTKSEAIPGNREDLINAYDNTIRYTDFFLHSIITRLEKTGGMSAMLYTSDHGENIFDDSHQLFLHASPRASQYELHVPLIVWLSQNHRNNYPAQWEAANINRQKQAQNSLNAFHTMLDIAGISTQYRKDSLSLASRQYKEQPLLYLNDHNKPIPQKDCGF